LQSKNCKKNLSKKKGRRGEKREQKNRKAQRDYIEEIKTKKKKLPPPELKPTKGEKMPPLHREKESKCGGEEDKRQEHPEGSWAGKRHDYRAKLPAFVWIA